MVEPGGSTGVRLYVRASYHAAEIFITDIQTDPGPVNHEGDIPHSHFPDSGELLGGDADIKLELRGGGLSSQDIEIDGVIF